MIELGLDSPYFAPALRRFVKLFDDFETALENAPLLAGQGFHLPKLAMPRISPDSGISASTSCSISIRVLLSGRSAFVERPSIREGFDRWFHLKYLALFEERRPET